MTKPTELTPEQRREFDRQLAIITRGIVELIPETEFHQKLADAIRTGTPLRVKQGFDPTAPDIHLGHAVGIRKLRQFQDLGHQIVLIVGDYTGLVGDPSGRSATRPQLAYDQIVANAETYQSQFFRILDRSRTEIHRNGDWFKKMEFAEVMKLASRFTVARLLERDDFSLRFKGGVPISLHELFYPLMQAYDSVAIRADVEIGATEQTFNLLAGRTVQEAYGVPCQVVLTLPILTGLDGERRMSKSLGNYVGITESPREMFGKLMSIPDRLIMEYFTLATGVPETRLVDIKQALDNGSANPMVFKKELARTIVDIYHQPGEGQAAQDEFERVFSLKQLPEDIEDFSVSRLQNMGIQTSGGLLVHLMLKLNLAKSASDGRRLIEGGGVLLGDQKVTDPNTTLDLEPLLNAEGSVVLKVGKRRFVRLTR